ncbi:MAG TPA: hypothetical protein VEM15_04160 [Thermodesulfobacteriota bacterium]|nr:hypothetical protein [Thermodesulfobacteriota bacterium]
MVEYGEVYGDIRRAVNPNISRCVEIGRSGHQDIRVQDIRRPGYRAGESLGTEKEIGR